MNPEDRRYTEKHQWAKLEGDTATIGITDFAQKELKDIVFIELPEPGKEFKKGDKLAVIESVKSVSDVYCPLDGSVVEVNKELEDQPDIINQDPYNRAWIAKLKIADKSDYESLMTSEQYESSTR